MQLPFTIFSRSGNEMRKRWETQFIATGRTALEGLWRRTQDARTATESGWRNLQDARRRMLHYYDQYDLHTEENACLFNLTVPYLWVSYAFPRDEVSAYKKQIRLSAEAGNWDSFQIDDSLNY